MTTSLLLAAVPAQAADGSAATAMATASATSSATTVAPSPATATVDSPSTVPRLDEREAVRLSQAALGRLVAEHTLLDTQGRPVRLSSFKGKPLLVSFIYTGCFQVCPLNTRSLLEAVQGMDRLLSADQFNVVSIGFNQPFDSPQAMRAFAAQHRVGYRNWSFLSPPAASVDALTRDFGFSYVATPAGFDHVLGVTVLDAEGRVYAQVYGERMTADKLGEPLRQLLTHRPQPQGLNLAELVERVRILCTVYDPETGAYRYNYALLLEIVGGIGFFVTMAVYFLLEWRSRRRARRAAAPMSLTPREALR